MSALILPKHWRFNLPMLMGHLKKGAGGHLLHTGSGHLVNDCGEAPCVRVTTVTLDTDQECLTAFAATYALSTTSLPGPGTCSYSTGCFSHVTSFNPAFQLDTYCDTDAHYGAARILIWAFGLVGGYVGIRIQCIWVVGFTEYALNGKFESFNSGVTFGSFVIDEWPAGCAAPPASNGPANGSDFTCSATVV